MNLLKSHSLAKELLNKPNGFITVNIGEKEYAINNIKRNCTYANRDDSIIYWNICIDTKKECEGNVKR